MNVLMIPLALSLIATPVLAQEACPCPPAPYDDVTEAAIAAYARCQVRGVLTVTFETTDGLTSVVNCLDPEVMFWEPTPEPEPEEPEEPEEPR